MITIKVICGYYQVFDGMENVYIPEFFRYQFSKWVEDSYTHPVSSQTKIATFRIKVTQDIADQINAPSETKIEVFGTVAPEEEL